MKTIGRGGSVRLGSRLAVVLAVAPAVVLGAGCGVNLLVGETEATVGDGTSTGELETTGAGPVSSTGHDSTGAHGDGTSTGAEHTSTGQDVEGTTSTGEAAEGSTTSVEIPCSELGFNDCNELSYCLWYGLPEEGGCEPNPCENPMHDCWELPMGDCEALLACAWVGEPETGECAPIECVPCEILSLDQCEETPTCEWLPVKEICVA